MTGFATRQDFSLRRMGSRMLQAARFNGDTFRELRDDPSTTVQSVSLVAIIGLCYGAGPGLFGYFNGDFSALWTSVVVILTVLLASISIAIVWSGITWSPGPLFLFTLTPNPVVSDITRAVGSVWIVVANVFAVKNAVGVSTQQSMLTFIISIVFLIFLGALVLAVIQFLSA